VPPPRNQPYLFAHRFLPQEAHQQPERLWNSVTGPEWSSYLSQLWTMARQDGDERIPIKGLGVEGILTGQAVTLVEGHELVFMSMPTPAGATEAFWVVLARRQGTTRPLRYFTFEQRADDPTMAVMAEWTAEGSHINYGEAGRDLKPADLRDLVMLELSSQAMSANRGAGAAPGAALAAAPPRAGALAGPFVCELSTLNQMRIWAAMPLCGIGLIWWVLFQKDPKVLDPEGVTLRSGKRYLWRDATDLVRVRVVGAISGAKRDYYIRISFGNDIVNLTPGELKNGDAALEYLEAVLGTRLHDVR
jgi:hypothetical protein